MLYSINRQTGIEYLVYTIKSLNGEDIETCANRLFRTAGLGDKEKDNGLLLLISYDDRKFRLEVGYGLEGDIPDTQAANIINTMTPYFKEGKGTTVVMLLPVSTDSKWFQENIYLQPGVKIKFLPERVKFVNSLLPSYASYGQSSSAKVCGGTRPSMVVTFDGSKHKFRCE